MKISEIQAVWVSDLFELRVKRGALLGLKGPEPVQAVADDVGVSRQTIYNWEEGRGLDSLTATYVARLCRHFGVPFQRTWHLEISEDEDTREFPALQKERDQYETRKMNAVDREAYQQPDELTLLVTENEISATQRH
jgi:DNA-binding XRE family transcriptional regulator